MKGLVSGYASAGVVASAGVTSYVNMGEADDRVVEG